MYIQDKQVMVLGLDYYTASSMLAAATHPPHAVASALQRRGCRCAPCQVMAFVQAGNLCVNIGLILLPTAHTWRPGDHRKATLGPRKTIVLLLTYVAALVGYAVHLFSLD